MKHLIAKYSQPNIHGFGFRKRGIAETLNSYDLSVNAILTLYWEKRGTTALRLRIAQSGAKSLQPPAPPNSPAPSGRHIPLLTELETLFDFGCYNYAAPDGAE